MKLRLALSLLFSVLFSMSAFAAGTNFSAPLIVSPDSDRVTSTQVTMDQKDLIKLLNAQSRSAPHDCDDDECAYVFLVILFVLLTVVLVVGAALIPHMWVLSCLVLLTLIALLALHEIRRDRGLQQRYGRASRSSEPGS